GVILGGVLVERYGGSVAATSPGPGQAATVTIVLPVVPIYQATANGVQVHPTARHLLPSADYSASLDGLVILVVDDEPDTRELLRTSLSECGALVTVAASVDEAFAAFEAAIPDILISDIGMPDVDGYELIRRLRELPLEGGGKVPAIALTAYAR